MRGRHNVLTRLSLAGSLAVVLAAGAAATMLPGCRAPRPYPSESDSYPLSIQTIYQLENDSVWDVDDVAGAFLKIKKGETEKSKDEITWLADTRGYLPAIAADPYLGLARTFSDLRDPRYANKARHALRILDDTARSPRFGYQGHRAYGLGVVDVEDDGEGLTAVPEEKIREVALAAMASWP